MRPSGPGTGWWALPRRHYMTVGRSWGRMAARRRDSTGCRATVVVAAGVSCARDRLDPEPPAATAATGLVRTQAASLQAEPPATSATTLRSCGRVSGAEAGTRTPMTLRSLAPEASASANSATSACVRAVRCDAGSSARSWPTSRARPRLQQERPLYGIGCRARRMEHRAFRPSARPSRAPPGRASRAAPRAARAARPTARARVAESSRTRTAAGWDPAAGRRSADR